MSFRLPKDEISRRAKLTAYRQPEGPEDNRTEQSHRDSCDINILMAKYEKTGFVGHVSESPPNFGDFTQVSDYQSACNAVIAAEDAFMSLNANVRAKFENDPQKFLLFMDDEKNYDEALRLGLVAARPVPDATMKDVVEAVKSIKPEPKRSSSRTREED